MLNRKAKILLLDDMGFVRDALKSVLEKHFVFIEIITPSTTNEVEICAKKDIYDGYLIDIKLDLWFKDKQKKSIEIQKKTCLNGIGIAKVLNNTQTLSPKKKIAVYSKILDDPAFQQELIELPETVKRITKLGATNQVQNIEPFKPFIYGILQVIYSKVKITRSQWENKLPNSIKTYFAKKTLLNNPTGVYKWIAGEYKYNIKYLKEDDKESTHDLELIFAKKKFNPPPSCLIFTKENEARIDLHNENNLDNAIYSYKNLPKKYEVLSNIFISQNVIDFHTRGLLNLKDTFFTLKELEDFGKLEASKYFIRKVIDFTDLNSLFSKYNSKLIHYNIPLLTEIYNGQIRRIDEKNNIAMVKLVRLYPYKKEKLEPFNFKILKTHGISMLYSKFEYTIYRPPTNGYAFNLEPR